MDLDQPATVCGRSGLLNQVLELWDRSPGVAVQVEDVRFLRANTHHPIKITVPGPFTMLQQAQNE